MDPITYQQIKKVATNLIRFMQRRWRPDTIFDDSMLPAPKEQIIADCLCFLESTKNPHARANVEEYMLPLSFYQSGVGSQPLDNCRFELFPMQVDSLPADGFASLKAAVSEHLPHLDPDHFLNLLGRVQADFKRIEAACEDIEKNWELSDASSPTSGAIICDNDPSETPSP